MVNTTNQNYPKPVATNNLSADVVVLQTAFDKVDLDVKSLFTAMDTKSPNGHGHVVAGVAGLQGELDAKASTGHTHALDNLTDVDGAAGAAAGMLLQKTPTGFVPVSVSAAVGSIVTGLVNAGLAAKLDKSQLPAAPADDDYLVYDDVSGAYISKTPTDVLAHIGAYGTGNIVGTVTEVGGLPTGAIIESGSNANGKFIKYADGTLVCHVRTNVTISASTTYSSSSALTWPIPFITTLPSVTVSGLNNYANAHGVATCTSATLTSFQLRCFRLVSGSNSAGYMTVGIIAIGRWF